MNKYRCEQCAEDYATQMRVRIFPSGTITQFKVCDKCAKVTTSDGFIVDIDTPKNDIKKLIEVHKTMRE